MQCRCKPYKALVRATSRCPCACCARRAALPLVLAASCFASVLVLLSAIITVRSGARICFPAAGPARASGPRSLCAAYYQVDELADAHLGAPRGRLRDELQRVLDDELARAEHAARKVLGRLAREAHRLDLRGRARGEEGRDVLADGSLGGCRR